MELAHVNGRFGIKVGGGNTGNTDQTAFFFAMPKKKSFAPVGAVQVPCKISGQTKLRFTVQLCIMDDGCY